MTEASHVHAGCERGHGCCPHIHAHTCTLTTARCSPAWPSTEVCELWVNLSQGQISSSNFLRVDEMIAQCQRHRRYYLHYSPSPSASPPPTPAGKINDGIQEFSIGNFYHRIFRVEQIHEGETRREENGDNRFRRRSARGWTSPLSCFRSTELSRLNWRRASRVANDIAGLLSINEASLKR